MTTHDNHRNDDDDDDDDDYGDYYYYWYFIPMGARLHLDGHLLHLKWLKVLRGATCTFFSLSFKVSTREVNI